MAPIIDLYWSCDLPDVMVADDPGPSGDHGGRDVGYRAQSRSDPEPFDDPRVAPDRRRAAMYIQTSKPMRPYSILLALNLARILAHGWSTLAPSRQGVAKNTTPLTPPGAARPGPWQSHDA